MHPKTLDKFETARRRGALDRRTAPTPWFETCLSEEELFRHLTTAQHFHFDQTTFDVLRHMALAESEYQKMTGGTGWTFPETGTLPAKRVVISVDMGNDFYCFLLERGIDPESQVHFGSLRGGDGAAFLIAFTPGGLPMMSGDWFRALQVDHSPKQIEEWETITQSFAFHCAFCLAAINEPRILNLKPGKSSRSERRRASRLGASAEDWTDVSWRVGGRTTPKVTPEGEKSHPKALHFCRGHFRRSEERHPASRWIKHPVTKREGWFTWVRECWKGDPAFGFNVHRYRPQIGGHKPEKIEAGTALPETKAAALSAAQRAAMAEAGFAPTETVQ